MLTKQPLDLKYHNFFLEGEPWHSSKVATLWLEGHRFEHGNNLCTLGYKVVYIQPCPDPAIGGASCRALFILSQDLFFVIKNHGQLGEPCKWPLTNICMYEMLTYIDPCNWSLTNICIYNMLSYIGTCGWYLTNICIYNTHTYMDTYYSLILCLCIICQFICNITFFLFSIFEWRFAKIFYMESANANPVGILMCKLMRRPRLEIFPLLYLHVSYHIYFSCFTIFIIFMSICYYYLLLVFMLFSYNCRIMIYQCLLGLLLFCWFGP